MDLVRSDSVVGDINIFLLVVILAAVMGFNMSTDDIKGGYMQSGTIQRDIYFRPPKYFRLQLGTASNGS